MATANPPPGALAVDSQNGADPFAAGAHDPARQRYAAFDNSQFSLYLNGSPVQAKRALQAHLAETTRRLQETSHLGNSLVQQRKELEEKLHEVEQQEQESDIGPELRQRLAELEKEFNEVGRETARAFLPKSRVSSGEHDTAAGVSVYSSEAMHSPTKVSVPSRKQRNQQPSRINDIALATEISTSLLAQLKDLQAVLLEKDDALKAADLDRSQLEIEVEGLSQRLRTLDESESRLKDVNWNLETQVRESEAMSKSAAEKENRLNHTLSLVRAEKSTLERELEDLRQQHAKLNDDHINKSKQIETELSSLRRNVTLTETEKNALQRKVEDLSNQNQELARAVAYRLKADEQVTADETSQDEGGEERETPTPEHSPPPSPSKATPRHGMLESETLKHSLQHAHRMIQQLKNNIHREKTEKIELKRMLQDARDELETNRGPLNGPGSAGKRKKTDKDGFKKPARPDRLGALRSGTQEILEDDEEWEEQEGVPATPSRRPRQADVVSVTSSHGYSSAADTSANEGFETANETSDAAFETANERDGMTETEAFMTGAETLDGGSSDELTETEAGAVRVTSRPSRSSLRSSLTRDRHHDSYESTASTSGDEFKEMDFKTPIQNQHPRFRLKARQSSSRRSTPRGGLDFVAGKPPITHDSPASFASSSRDNTPAHGKSLFAELEGLSGDEDDASMGEGTPSRSSVLHSPETSPSALRKSVLGKSPFETAIAKPTMVDSGMMTDEEPRQAVGLASMTSQGTQPQPPRPASLHMSSLFTQHTSPRLVDLPTLLISPLSTQETGPKLAPAPLLHLSNVSGHATTPVAPKATPAVPLNISSVSGHHTEPRLIASPTLGLSNHSSRETQPVAPAETTSSLGVSQIAQQSSGPAGGLMSKALAPAALLASAIHSQSTEAESTSRSMSNDAAYPTDPANTPRPQLSTYSTMSSQATQPSAPKQAASQLSQLLSHTTEPVAPRPQRLDLSSFSSWGFEPTAPRLPNLQVSAVSSRQSEPVVPAQVVSQMSSVSHQSSVPIEPCKQMLSVSPSMVSRSSQPMEPSRPAPSEMSILSAQATAPRMPQRQNLQHGNISTQYTEPIVAPMPLPSPSNLSDVTILHDTKPESPTLPSFLPDPSRPSTAKKDYLPTLSLSTNTAQDSEPNVPSRPVTAHKTGPVPFLTSTTSSQVERAEPSKPGFFDSVLPWSKDKRAQSGAEVSDARQQRTPLEGISANAQPKAPRTPMADGATQTMVSADQIDKLLMARSPRYSSTIAAAGVEKSMSPPPSPSRRHSHEGRTPRRPGSSSSMRSRGASPPPLPPDHKEVIAAAAKSLPPSTPGPPGGMGPPAMPASAYKKRPQTPSIKISSAALTPKTVGTGGTTPRPRRQSQRGDARSGASSPISRRSSLSSFTSEVDQRFNMQGGPSFAPNGLPTGATDPRMIQAITQTMIGEYLWKYTRKTGREGLSENRHRRFFWIHPYTRTLYWSDRDPQTAGKAELKGKSVAIESVQEVDDGNPLPPGLHQKSLLIITPGRSIKFTATTGQRHETWFNALSYLCERVEEGDHQEQRTDAADEIQDEFNGGYRSSSRATGVSRASMASYVTRRTSSPHTQEIPTLRQRNSSQQRAVSTEPGQSSVSSRFSILRPNSAMRGSFSSRLSRTSVRESSTYEEPSGSIMDLGRDIHDHVERDLDNMVNVRACCDGRHDVGHLHMHSLKGRHSSNNVNSRPSFIGSLSSRAASRSESRTSTRTEGA